MNLTREQAIEHACRTVALVYRSIGDYSKPSDGFCQECSRRALALHLSYDNAGLALDYVRVAVMDRLERDGYGKAMKKVIEQCLDLSEGEENHE